MAPEFRYSLTRICLRTGQLSLSRRMAELFPEAGKVRALDTVTDNELELTIGEPRKVSGLAAYMERHRLDVNDEILLRLREDGRLALTPLPRPGRRSLSEAELAELLDSLVGETPLTEAEIRALHPRIPADYPLTEALAAHPRLQLRAGRWVGEVTPSRGLGTASEEAEPALGESSGPNALDTAEGSRRPEAGGPDADGGAGGPDGPDATEGVADPEAPDQASRRADPGEDPIGASDGPDRGESSSGRGAARRPRSRGRPGRPAAVTPYPRGVLFPGEAALNSQRPAGDLKLVNRARDALSGFGYRVEGLPHGMLLARADLGRRNHTVLVRVLGDGERLDWAALLSRRREQTADYLAVFGDHRDLHRLTAPAELARATLWSWDGIARVQNLSTTVLIGPFDLEPHFAKDGMFENGLKQFERSLSRMIAEKGALSAVITRLGTLRAPAVFVVDDLVEGDLQREQVVKALELLGQAPFHLVARIDRGEYCLRHSVAESLAHLSEYALSLGERLPRTNGRRSRTSTARRGEQAERATGELELAEES